MKSQREQTLEKNMKIFSKSKIFTDFGIKLFFFSQKHIVKKIYT